MSAELGAPHDFRAVDIALDKEVAGWAQSVLSGVRAPDLLINNAARMSRVAPLWELASEEIEPVIAANINGTINAIRHFLPAMISRGSGVVVNFSSGWGRSTSPEVATYCTTKWAIEGLTSALAQELPKGLAAVALNPGIIATDMLKSCWGEAAAAYPGPSRWILAAGPFLESLGPRHNGQALTVPGAATD